MKKDPLKLKTKITLLTIVIVLISISSIMFFMTGWMTENIRNEVKNNITNVAKLLSNNPIVFEGLSNPTHQFMVQPYTMKLLEATKNIEIIVVADMQGIRVAHPYPERIGGRFVGGDEKEVLKGKAYISEAIGTLGHQMRAFEPVYDKGGRQVGFVMVGVLTENIYKIERENQKRLILFSAVGIIIGTIGAFILSTNIKRTLLGLEPKEISKMYLEKKGMLDAIHEGIIAIDGDLRITLVNDSAIELLGLEKENIVGKPITDVFPTSKLQEVLETGESEYNREQLINNTIIISNQVPLRDKDTIIGAIATFRDKTMLTKMAEEITGVRQIVESLRANTHEFMNKLHVVLGLLQFGDVEGATKYIVSETERQQQIVNLIMKKIKDPMVAALILGKFSRAKELGIHLHLELESYLLRREDRINSHVLVTIIGNLIENAFDAVSATGNDIKSVRLLIKENEKQIKLRVVDNGIGIKPEEQNKIFKRGYSTKEGSRGVGLALVQEVIESLNGIIIVESGLDQGTTIHINIPKGGGVE